MTQHTEKKYKSISKYQIDELTSIYDDYLFIVRQHENLFNMSSVTALGREQQEIMTPGDPDAWKVIRMTKTEKQEFEDFVNNNIFQDDTRTYITLRHIKSEEDNGYRTIFTIPPYRSTSINMQLPSNIERCSIAYPENGTMGNTTFYIDGLYKAIYTGPQNRDKPLSEFVHDEDIISEFYVLVRLTEELHKNNYVNDAKFKKASQNVYAAERVIINENIILELLGSFAGKIIDICHKLYIGRKQKYSAQDNIDALECAEKEGLILSASDFMDYLNIRNFLRHQWDTLDELGYFSPKESHENKEKRTRYVTSYLKFCDKLPAQRVKTYIDILHQMQYVINTVNTNRIIRYENENNNKFTERARKAYALDPDNVYIELNYPLTHKKYASLQQRLCRFFPITNMVDVYPVNADRFTKINDYVFRSYFLHTFTATECMVMRHCQLRGLNKKRKEAWDHLEEIGFLSPKEVAAWRKYSLLRNLLSHNYYNDVLRARLASCEQMYQKDLEAITDKFVDMGPTVSKLKQGIYEYVHIDGLVVHLDHNHHVVLYCGKVDEKSELPPKELTDVNKPQTQQNLTEPQTEIYPNGVEYNLSGEQIKSVKLPIGITVDLDKHRIDFDAVAHWSTNTEQFHVLQTEKSKIVINKYLRVTEYREKNRHIPFQPGDKWWIDNRHNMYLDSYSRIQKFKFRNSKNQIVQIEFMYTAEGYNALIFSDGTIVLLAGKYMILRHSGQVLNFDNRKEFAATYINPNIMLQQIATNKKVH